MSTFDDTVLTLITAAIIVAVLVAIAAADTMVTMHTVGGVYR